MRKTTLATVLLAVLTGLMPLAISAQQTTTSPASQAAKEQVIVPDVNRRQLKLPRFPSKDFEISAFAGTYGAQNFGSSAVYGARLGYHITEDFFAEAAYARSQVSDENFRLILPGGIFPQPKETLSYYNLSVGYNVLPGEVFFGRNVAKASAMYLLGGIGSTRFLEQKRQTLNFGFGMRLLFSDRFAVRVDVRDHVYSLDLLGKRDSTQNLELTAGLAFFF